MQAKHPAVDGTSKSPQAHSKHRTAENLLLSKCAKSLLHRSGLGRRSSKEAEPHLALRTIQDRSTLIRKKLLARQITWRRRPRALFLFRHAADRRCTRTQSRGEAATATNVGASKRKNAGRGRRKASHPKSTGRPSYPHKRRRSSEEADLASQSSERTHAQTTQTRRASGRRRQLGRASRAALQAAA